MFFQDELWLMNKDDCEWCQFERIIMVIQARLFSKKDCSVSISKESSKKIIGKWKQLLFQDERNRIREKFFNTFLKMLGKGDFVAFQKEKEEKKCEIISIIRSTKTNIGNSHSKYYDHQNGVRITVVIKRFSVYLSKNQ